jgi:hypothetical protein
MQAALAPHLPEQLRQGVLEKALQIVLAMENEDDRASALAKLAPALSFQHLQHALQITQARTYERSHEQEIGQITPPAWAIRSLRREARDWEYVYTRARTQANAYEQRLSQILVALAPYLPEQLKRERLHEALRALQMLEDEEEWLWGVARLAPHLPENLLYQMAQSALAMKEKTGRAVALLLPLLFLPEGKKQQVAQELMNALSLEEKSDRADFLFVLLPYLSEEQKHQAVPEVLQALSSKENWIDEFEDALTLFVLLCYVTEKQKQQVVQEVLQALLTEAKWTEEKIERAKTLFVLLPYLSEEQKHQAVQAVWDDLPEEQQYKAARAVLHGIVVIVDPQNSEVRLPEQVTLLPYVQEERKKAAAQEAICAILAVMPGNPRPETLVAIAPYLPASLLPEVLMAVRGITNAERRLKLLLAMASRQFELPLQEILQAAQEIEHERLRTWAVTVLAPQLSESLLQEVNQNIGSITQEVEDTRAEEEALATVFPSVPKTLIQESIGEASKATYEGSRAEIVARICPYLSETQKFKTVREVLELEIEEELDWTSILAGMIPHLLHHPPSILYHLWCQLLHILARTTRQELLLNVRLLTPLILRLGGREAAVEVSHAILAVGNWWQ